MGVRSTEDITRREAESRLLAFIPTASDRALEDMLEWTDEFANFHIVEEDCCSTCGRPHK